MQACNNYCYTDEHFDDCIEVWKKGGLSQEQEKVKNCIGITIPADASAILHAPKNSAKNTRTSKNAGDLKLTPDSWTESEYQQNIDGLKALQEKADRELLEQDRIQNELGAAQKNDNSEAEQIQQAPQETISGGSDSSSSVGSGITGQAIDGKNNVFVNIINFISSVFN